MKVFFDSSAMTKRYVEEAGSGRVDELLLSADALGVSVLCVPEVVSALCRRRREGTLALEEYSRARQSLWMDAKDANVVVFNDRVLARAIWLLERFVLRSLDAIQIASSLEWSADVFVSADERQCTAAQASGLRVERVA